jgi:hypothetical protein
VTALALGPVSEAIYAALNVADMRALVPGGIWADIPQGTVFPALMFDVSEGKQLGGFGTKPGLGMLPEVEIRLHVFSQYAGWKEAQDAIEKARLLLADPPAVTGYRAHAIFWDEVIPLADELIAGVKVKELVANGRFDVEAI